MAKKKTVTTTKPVEGKVLTLKIKGEDASFSIEKFTSDSIKDRLAMIEKNQLTGPDFSKLGLPKQIAILNIYTSYQPGEEDGNIQQE